MASALAADGFAVSICRGAGSNRQWSHALWTGFVFGTIHTFMVGLGWWLGDILESWKNIAPYVACVMLVLLGGKMLWEGLGSDTEPNIVNRPANPLLALTGLLWAGLATSIDGIAGGITLPLLGLPLWFDALVVGGVTMLLCTLGYRAGTLLGVQWGQRATVLGGVCLILIGIHFVL